MDMQQEAKQSKGEAAFANRMMEDMRRRMAQTDYFVRQARRMQQGGTQALLLDTNEDLSWMDETPLPVLVSTATQVEIIASGRSGLGTASPTSHAGSYGMPVASSRADSGEKDSLIRFGGAHMGGRGGGDANGSETKASRAASKMPSRKAVSRRASVSSLVSDLSPTSTLSPTTTVDIAAAVNYARHLSGDGGLQAASAHLRPAPDMSSPVALGESPSAAAAKELSEQRPDNRQGMTRKIARMSSVLQQSLTPKMRLEHEPLARGMPSQPADAGRTGRHRSRPSPAGPSKSDQHEASKGRAHVVFHAAPKAEACLNMHGSATDIIDITARAWVTSELAQDRAAAQNSHQSGVERVSAAHKDERVSLAQAAMVIPCRALSSGASSESSPADASRPVSAAGDLATGSHEIAQAQAEHAHGQAAQSRNRPRSEWSRSGHEPDMYIAPVVDGAQGGIRETGASAAGYDNAFELQPDILCLEGASGSPTRPGTSESYRPRTSGQVHAEGPRRARTPMTPDGLGSLHAGSRPAARNQNALASNKSQPSSESAQSLQTAARGAFQALPARRTPSRPASRARQDPDCNVTPSSSIRVSSFR